MGRIQCEQIPLQNNLLEEVAGVMYMYHPCSKPLWGI